MILVKQIINANLKQYKDFESYLTIIQIIENNIEANPDISIESCKALVEGLSKSFLKHIDKGYNYNAVEGMDFLKLFKTSVNTLSIVCTEIEPDFVNKAYSLIQILGEIRNKRGDISHGRVAPKAVFSKPEFSKLVVQLTEGLVYYLLEQFYTVDLSDRQIINYEDNGDFNFWLDELNPIVGISYSKALFDQDSVVYLEQLIDYKEQQEIEKNEE